MNCEAALLRAFVYLDDVSHYSDTYLVMAISLFFPIFFLANLANAIGEDTSTWPKVNMPVGSLPEGSVIQVKVDKAGDAAFSADASGARAFKSADSGDFATVTSLKNAAVVSSDHADMNSYVKEGSLKVSSAQLKSSGVCTGEGGNQSCTLSAPIALERATVFNPNSFATAVTSPSGTFSSSAPVSTNPNLLFATMNAINKPLNSFKSSNGGLGAALANCPIFNSSTNNGYDNLPSSSSSGFSFFDKSGPPSCALRKAQDAFLKNKGQKVKQDIMIINDFSSGGVTGKMWFVNSNGTLANVGTPNPIDVARGDGGFGRGAGSHKTPNGAIATASYDPPRAGNISDGIELYGLEGSKNNDINGRGVLLHGWNPAGATQGCLGVCGSLKTRGRSYSSLGGADYLDILKQGLLKSGGVLIYNFTPDEKKSCN